MRTVLMISLLAALVAVPTSAQPPPLDKRPAEHRSLDRQLLDDLDRQLLEGLPPAGKLSTPGSSGKKGAGENAPQPDQKPAASGESTAASQNPLAGIALRMRTAQSRMAERDTSAATQEVQQQIVHDLAGLLEQARRQQGAAGSQPPGAGRGTAQAGVGSGNPAPGPARDSTGRVERGAKEQSEATDVKDLFRRIWGHLPDKLRDEMQASLSEQFLPKYERLIEEYYKRLAEEQSGR